MQLRTTRTTQALVFAVLVPLLLIAGSFLVARRSAWRVLWAPDLSPVEMSFSPRWWRRTPSEPSRLIVWRAWACPVDGSTCCFPPTIGLSARGDVIEHLPADTAESIERSRSPSGMDRALVSAVLRRIETRVPDADSLQGLSDVEGDLESAFVAHDSISRGGHDFWYRQKGREQTLRAASAFKRMGEVRAASAISRSLEAFPRATPTIEYLDSHQSSLRELFVPLDRSVSAVDFNAVAARYIRRKKLELWAADPGLTNAVPTSWLQ